MPSRSFPVGNSIQSMQAILGNVTVVNLTSAGATTAQGSYVAPSDVLVITAASGHTAVTLPDPYLLGMVPGDYFVFINASTTTGVIFPPTGGTINGGSANASVNCTASKVTVVFVTTVASGASTFSAIIQT